MNIKKEAEKLAKEMVKTLNKDLGGKWETRVWNNLGWHYSAVLGSIEVIESTYMGKSIYTAYINDEVNVIGGAMSAWFHDSDNAATPDQAVRNAITTANKYMESLKAVMDDNRVKIFIDKDIDI